MTGPDDLWTTSALQGLELVLLGTLVWRLTRHRRDVIPVAQVVRADAAGREVTLLLVYATLALTAAYVLPKAMGWHPFSWHLVGTLEHGTHLASPAEALAWAGYNLLVFAALPWMWFRRRAPGTDHCLRSTSKSKDAVIMAAVLVFETVVQVSVLHPPTLSLPLGELLTGALATFLLYFAGAVLPTAVFLQALLVPRVSAFTRSPAATVTCGGVLYATFHVWDGGFDHHSPTQWLIVLASTYALPGAFKTWLTLRTGNAWVHAWAYHALAPHTLLDTPMILRVFSL